MSKGYQIIEPFDLDDLIRHQKNHVVAVAMLKWLIAELTAALGDQLKGVELEVIMAQYVGEPYPTIGAHYQIQREDVEALVVETIHRLLRELRPIDFTAFVGSSPIDWNATMEKLRIAIESGRECP